ncbi:hypothetical protein EV360DRAFT_69085 [Lentinula raphanica]|nr:hypothetical protein EV360DRAFT_69085 [Lentinula raphanica]
MASTIARRPPLIVTNCPAPREVVHMLTLLKAMSNHLSGLPSFSSRMLIVELKWPRIMQWMVALLKPLSDFVNPAFRATELYTDVTIRCIVEVFAFLNAIASARTSTDAEVTRFVTKLASSSEMFVITANTWVAFFTRQWPTYAHCEVTSFLVMFGHTIGNTPFEHSLPVAIRNVCPGCELLPTWSTAIAELCAQPSSTVDSMIQAANRGLLIAATTTFFQPLPTLDKIHITLAQTHGLWSKLMENSYPPGLCYVAIHSLAKFSLLIVSGGPHWTAKALDADLLVLLTKTLAWIPKVFSQTPDESFHHVLTETLQLLLLYLIYKPVRRGVLGNLKQVQTQQLEELLGAVQCASKELWKLSAQTINALEILFVAIMHSSAATALFLVIARFIANGNIGERSIKRLVRNSDLSDLDCFQLLFRALIQIKHDRDDICLSISNQGLESSQIVIEFSFTTYPWSWKVFGQASAPGSQLYPPHHQQQDTLLAVKCPRTDSTAISFVRGIRRAALLDPACELVYEGVGGQVAKQSFTKCCAICTSTAARLLECFNVGESPVTLLLADGRII